MSASADLLLWLARRLAQRYRGLPGYDYEDLVQEAYLAMLRAPEGRTPYQRRSFGWSRLSRLARQARRMTVLPLLGQVEAAEAEPPGDMAERVRQLLPARQAEIIIGLFCKGLTCAELAQQLGLSDGRVFQIRDQALARLRQLMR